MLNYDEIIKSDDPFDYAFHAKGIEIPMVPYAHKVGEAILAKKMYPELDIYQGMKKLMNESFNKGNAVTTSMEKSQLISKKTACCGGGRRQGGKIR